VVKKTVFLALVIVQLTCICVLVYRLFKNHPVVLGAYSLSPIDKASVSVPTDSLLHYYYELQPNSVKYEDLEFLGLSGEVKHTINQDGLNERYDYKIPKLDDTYRIVVLGDSFTEGMFVDTEKNYVELLEDRLNGLSRCANWLHFDVINLGVEGYDMQYTAERWKRKGIKYAPDLVILLTEEDDFTYPNELFHPVVERIHKELDASSTADMQPTDQPKDFYEAWTIAYKEILRIYDGDISRIVFQSADHLKTITTLYNGPLVLVTLKNTSKLVLQELQQIQKQRPQTFLFIIDGYDMFPDGHPSNEGHRQFAQFMYDKITERNIVSCNIR
jgi:hypothetical protein